MGKKKKINHKTPDIGYGEKTLPDRSGLPAAPVNETAA